MKTSPTNELSIQYPVYLRLSRESPQLIKCLLEDPQLHFVSGESHCLFDEKINEFYKRIPYLISKSNDHSLSMDEVNGELEYQRALGDKIIKSCIPQNIVDALKERHSRTGKLLEVKIVTEDKYLESLPWELISNPLVTKSVGLGSLCVTRFVDTEKQNSKDTVKDLSLPRVMVVSAQPNDHASSHYDLELEEIENQLKIDRRDEPRFIFHSLKHARYIDFIRDLGANSPTVLHIALHGTANGVYFERGNANQLIPYVTLLEDIKQINNLELIFLNVCNSAQSANPLISLNFARALVDAGIPSVVGLTTQFTPRASLEFSRWFYAGLAHGDSVTLGFNRAVDQLRGYKRDESLLWSVPVLYQSSNVTPFPAPTKSRESITSDLLNTRKEDEIKLHLAKRLKVFLCHSSQDKSVVRELYNRLIRENWIDPWLDEANLLPGHDWVRADSASLPFNRQSNASMSADLTASALLPFLAVR